MYWVCCMLCHVVPILYCVSFQDEQTVCGRWWKDRPECSCRVGHATIPQFLLKYLKLLHYGISSLVYLWTDLNTIFLFTHIYIYICIMMLWFFETTMKILWEDIMVIHFGNICSLWYIYIYINIYNLPTMSKLKPLWCPSSRCPNAPLPRLGGPNISILCHSTHDHLFQLNRALRKDSSWHQVT